MSLRTISEEILTVKRVYLININKIRRQAGQCGMRPLHALIQPQRAIAGALVLDSERAAVTALDQRAQGRRQVDVAAAELATLRSAASFQVDVRDEGPQRRERGGARDAGSFEVNRIEIHPHVRPVGR